MKARMGAFDSSCRIDNIRQQSMGGMKYDLIIIKAWPARRSAAAIPSALSYREISHFQSSAPQSSETVRPTPKWILLDHPHDRSGMGRGYRKPDTAPGCRLSAAARGRSPEAAARRAGLEMVEKRLTGGPVASAV
jgi:hypothetical protein